MQAREAAKEAAALLERAKQCRQRGGGADSRALRSFYCELELFRLRVETAEQASGASGTGFGSVLDVLDEARQEVKIKAPRLSLRQRVGRILKLLLCLAYTLLSIPVFWATAPLRLLHPLLRVLGLSNNFLPIDIVQKYFARGVLAITGICVRWNGKQRMPLDEASLCMFSHASNLDPFIVASGQYAFKVYFVLLF
jgi:hypothetical protein